MWAKTKSVLKKKETENFTINDKRTKPEHRNSKFLHFSIRKQPINHKQPNAQDSFFFFFTISTHFHPNTKQVGPSINPREQKNQNPGSPISTKKTVSATNIMKEM